MSEDEMNRFIDNLRTKEQKIKRMPFNKRPTMPREYAPKMLVELEELIRKIVREELKK